MEVSVGRIRPTYAMKKEILLKQSPTAQVRLLTLEVLSDGQVHSRKDFLAHIKEISKKYGIDNYSMGCISGGIQQAVNSKGCEKIGSATYQISGGVDMSAYGADDEQTTGDSEAMDISLKSAEICGEFVQRLTALSRTVDFVKADDSVLQQLMQMRECISDINGWIEKFRGNKGRAL